MAVIAARSAKPRIPFVRRSVIPGADVAHVLEGAEFQPWRRVGEIEDFTVDPFRISVSIRRLRIHGMASDLPKLHLDIVDDNRRHFTVIAGDVALAFHGPEEGGTEMRVFLRPEAPAGTGAKGQAIVMAIRDEVNGDKPDLTLIGG